MKLYRWGFKVWSQVMSSSILPCSSLNSFENNFMLNFSYFASTEEPLTTRHVVSYLPASWQLACGVRPCGRLQSPSGWLGFLYLRYENRPLYRRRLLHCHWTRKTAVCWAWEHASSSVSILTFWTWSAFHADRQVIMCSMFFLMFLSASYRISGFSFSPTFFVVRV